MQRSYKVLLAVSIALLSHFTSSQRTCDQRSCYPATGDLLVGREDKLYANSTCGLRRPTKYCIVGFLLENEKCFYCDSRSVVDSRPDAYVFSHLPKYMVSRSPDNRLKTWWQAENGVESVSIQLDLEAEFHFTHLIMTFKTFRPAGMIVEKSSDFQRTWKAYRYFAADCDKTFPGIQRGPQQKIDDVICEEGYSHVEPSTKGEVVMKVLDPLIPVDNPYSLEVQNLLKLTNLRVTFTKLHSLGDALLDAGADVQQKYYYALYEMVIRGSCSCYGHADECIPVPGAPNDPNMVHGQCNCTHFTQGRNCEQCKDGYWDLPWRPALGDQTNACKKCNCNGHTDKCHFDVAVYEATGQVSGGVCDECQHNTTGRQCGECIALFYRDPAKTLSDPNVCLPCNCDPAGSIGGGECEAVTDLLKGTVAGRCICKPNVEGERCDRCKAGHWNLLESDLNGCQSCNCDSRGTVGNNLCDSVTGQCTCKRFVEGTKCNQCFDGFWGVGSSLDGCQLCNCDLGGSYSTNCDKITGSCSCRPNIIGRKCDKVRPGYFFALPDQDTFEAEDAVPSKGTFTEVKGDPLGTGMARTWTGNGFASIPGNSAIDFTMVRVPLSGDYGVYIRYRSKGNVNWANVELTATRTDGRDLSGGPCRERFLSKTMSSYLIGREDVAEFQPSVCLQKGLVYNFKLSLPPSQGFQRDEELQVDSIVLLPKPDSINLFNSREGALLKRTYINNKCDSYFLSLTSERRNNIPDECLKAVFSISADMHDGALGCQCDPVGTKAEGGSDVLVCKSAGGQCPCKANVIGRRCDRCAAGAYGFGPEGCKVCGCDLVGSKDRFCDLTTGQCKCEGLVEGLQCDRCPPTYFGFPGCEPCDCSNHSVVCHEKTGVCLNCKDNTAGPTCGQCAPGYYGDATIGLPTDCQRCQCPGGNTGNQFSTTCSVQSLEGRQEVLCDNCEPGYSGQQCEKCDNGYFGNPLAPGGSCKKCDCSGNIDKSSNDKCDAVTGQCKNCLHDTEGFNCEKCKPWTFGNARNQSCTECICNKLGTDYSGDSTCDRTSGQCPCLMNVDGIECDKCKPGYWNLASGKGCTECNCSVDGSMHGQCNQLDGQCKCRVGFGGQDCTECEDFNYGDPHKKCSACLCNPSGSVSQQCNRKTGQCQCKPGVIGHNCDMCDAGTTGLMPKCERCHPCYDQWDDTLSKIELNITSGGIIDNYGNATLNVSGITQYEKQVTELNDRLNKLLNQLNGTLKGEEIDVFRRGVVDFNSKLSNTTMQMEKINEQQHNISEANNKSSGILDSFDLKMKKLEKKAKDLIKNMTDIIESNVDGAYNSTLNSLERSRAAGRVVNASLNTLADTEKNLDTIKSDYYATNDSSLSNLHDQNNNKLTMLSMNITALNDVIDELNRMLCGASVDCGGCNATSCASCGMSGNCTGVRHLAMKALSDAMKANIAIKRKEGMVNGSLSQLKLLEVDVKAALDVAGESLTYATNAKMLNEDAIANITLLINDILAFLNGSFSHPNETRSLIEKTLALKISLTPEEITNLADQIKVTVANLTGVAAILEASKADLDLATGLKQKALEAKLRAEKIMNDTMLVVEKLHDANERQNNTQMMMEMAENDISKAKELIDKTNKKNDDLEKLLLKALDDVNKMSNETVPELDDLYAANRVALDKAQTATDEAVSDVNKANQTSVTIQGNLESLDKSIESNNASAKDAMKRALKLADNSQAVYENALMKLKELEDLSTRYSRNEQRSKDLSKELAELDARITLVLGKIRQITLCHAQCNPGAATFCQGLQD